MMQRLMSLTVIALCVVPLAAGGEPTAIEVRVRSKGAKFIGTSMGGVRVVVRDAETDEILAQGITSGTTGNTERMMVEPRQAGTKLSTPDAASFRADIDIDEPIQVRVDVSGPLAQRQATGQASLTQWVVPGRDLTGGDGVLLTLPGFVVDILSPPTHVKLSGIPQEVRVHANVTLMCGCPVEPGGLWDAREYEVGGLLKRDGKQLATTELEFAGETSQFACTLHIEQPGRYEMTVFAYDPHHGNTGVDSVTFLVSE